MKNLTIMWFNQLMKFQIYTLSKSNHKFPRYQRSRPVLSKNYFAANILVIKLINLWLCAHKFGFHLKTKLKTSLPLELLWRVSKKSKTKLGFVCSLTCQTKKMHVHTPISPNVHCVAIQGGPKITERHTSGNKDIRWLVSVDGVSSPEKNDTKISHFG